MGDILSWGMMIQNRGHWPGSIRAEYSTGSALSGHARIHCGQRTPWKHTYKPRQQYLILYGWLTILSSFLVYQLFIYVKMLLSFPWNLRPVVCNRNIIKIYKCYPCNWTLIISRAMNISFRVWCTYPNLYIMSYVT